MDKIRADLKEILLNKAHEREREGKRTDNQLLSENLNGQFNGIYEAYYLVNNYLKTYEGDKKGDT